MTDDFAEIGALADALLRQLGPGERRLLLGRLARYVRKSQADRIRSQRDPEGQAFAPRRQRAAPKPGKHAVRFLYPKGSPNPRVVFMKSWVREGPLVTGFDIEAGGIRSFAYDKVGQRLPVEAHEENASSGKFRRQGRIRQKAMFRKLAGGRYLRAGATDSEAWIGFSDGASRIATIHQDGLPDKPSARTRAVRYARRRLLGLTPTEQARALDMLLDHVASPR